MVQDTQNIEPTTHIQAPTLKIVYIFENWIVTKTNLAGSIMGTWNVFCWGRTTLQKDFLYWNSVNKENRIKDEGIVVVFKQFSFLSSSKKLAAEELQSIHWKVHTWPPSWTLVHCLEMSSTGSITTKFFKQSRNFLPFTHLSTHLLCFILIYWGEIRQ